MKNKDLSLILIPTVNEFKGQVHDLAFEEPLANAAVTQVAEQAVNSWLTESKTRQQFTAYRE